MTPIIPTTVPESDIQAAINTIQQFYKSYNKDDDQIVNKVLNESCSSLLEVLGSSYTVLSDEEYNSHLKLTHKIELSEEEKEKEEEITTMMIDDDEDDENEDEDEDEALLLLDTEAMKEVTLLRRKVEEQANIVSELRQKVPQRALELGRRELEWYYDQYQYQYNQMNNTTSISRAAAAAAALTDVSNTVSTTSSCLSKQTTTHQQQNQRWEKAVTQMKSSLKNLTEAFIDHTDVTSKLESFQTTVDAIDEGLNARKSRVDLAIEEEEEDDGDDDKSLHDKTMSSSLCDVEHHYASSDNNNRVSSSSIDGIALLARQLRST